MRKTDAGTGPPGPPPAPKPSPPPGPPPGPGREAARRLAADWPALTPEQRLTIATLLRPDLPVGIERNAVGPTRKQRAA